MDEPNNKKSPERQKRRTYDLNTVPDPIVEGVRQAKMDPKYNYLNMLLAADEYGKIKPKKPNWRQSISVQELSLDEIADIANGQMDERHTHLNKLLDKP